MSAVKEQAYTLAGKVALITGSGRGASVVVNYSSSQKPAAEAVAEIERAGGTAVAIQADVSKTAEVARLFREALAHFGYLDIVVSNSGTEVFKPEDQVTEADYDAVFGLNTRAQFFVAQHAYKHLRDGGRIVLTSSIAAGMSGVPNHALYADSKAAVEGFTRSFAVDCGPRRITVNAIAPGGVKTDMYEANAWHYSPGATPQSSIEDIDKGLASICPLKRVAVPRDIAKVVAFLCHGDSEWINGQVLTLTGGSFA